MIVTILLVAFAYLSGSLPTGVLLSRLVLGTDVRQIGSGNFGAANVTRAAGYKIGILVALIDIAKGVVPVLIGAGLGQGHTALAIIAVAAVLGHDFSIFVKFKGGKGVATTFGVALALMPLAALAAAVVWLLILAIWRYPSASSMAALAVLPLAAYFGHAPPAYVLAMVALCVLGIGKHWENILRLATGTESRLRARPADGA